jgi:hypothetical protein
LVGPVARSLALLVIESDVSLGFVVPVSVDGRGSAVVVDVSTGNFCCKAGIYIKASRHCGTAQEGIDSV